MSYRNLEIWERAKNVSIAIHKMTLTDLPKFEMFEEGSQIRRSSKSTRTNIVEGYSRRKYVNEYIRFLTFSIASNDETKDHLETLYETRSLTNKTLCNDLLVQIDVLGKKLNLFIQAVERSIQK
jgi:four helix bundle protein